MWAMHRGFVNPELVGWHRSAEALLMILLGGLTTLHGPIIGALCYVGLLREFASLLVPERTLLVEGLVILAIVLALPQGLTGAQFGVLRLRGFWRPATGDATSRERSATGDG